MKPRVTIGVDIGQRVDPTAIAVVEHEERIESGRLRSGEAVERRVWHHTARYLARLPLGTPYPEVAERLATMAASVSQANRAAADAVPRRDRGRAARWSMCCGDTRSRRDSSRSYFTHGDRRIRARTARSRWGRRGWSRGCRRSSRASGCIYRQGTPRRETMANELLDYEIRVDQNANDKYGAFKVGTHDDLVTALGAGRADRW